MLSVSTRIWTCVAVSIPYDDNHYTIDIQIFANKWLLIIDGEFLSWIYEHTGDFVSMNHLDR